MKRAAALGLVLGLGILAGHAVASGALPALLPTSTVKLTTSVKLPTTTTIPLTTSVKLPTTTTIPLTTSVKLPTTTVKVTTTTVPIKTTTVKVPTTTVKVPTTTVRVTTTTTPKVTTSGTATPTTVKVSTTSTGSVTQSVTSATGSVTSTRTSRTSGSGSSAFSSAFTPFTGAYSGGAGNSASGGGGRGESASNSASSPRVQRLQVSRPYLTKKGPKAKRKIILTFRLARAGRVFFVIKQLSPECDIEARYSIRGRKGLNRVPFSGRVRGKELEPGTYRISVRTRNARVVRRATIVIIERGRLSHAELIAARSANVCPPPSAADNIFGTSPFGSTGTSDLAGALQVGGSDSDAQPPTGGLPTPDVSPGGVLGTAVQKTADTIRPFLIALLVAAILALALASMPQVALLDNRVQYYLARHRLEIVAVGAAALAAVALLFLVR